VAQAGDHSRQQCAGGDRHDRPLSRAEMRRVNDDRAHERGEERGQQDEPQRVRPEHAPQAYARRVRFGKPAFLQLAKAEVRREDLKVVSGRTVSFWERGAWAAGIVFVVALLTETGISAGVPIDQNDSAAKIAGALHDHRTTLLVVAYLSAVYAVAFVIYLCRLHQLLRRAVEPPGALHSFVLVGGVLLVLLHAISVFLVAAGVLAMKSGVLPRWLAWLSIVAAILLFLQGFGLGGVIATFGLILDLIGFVLSLLFVLLSSVILLRRGGAVLGTEAPGAYRRARAR
jgi:hypothetical protein